MSHGTKNRTASDGPNAGDAAASDAAPVVVAPKPRRSHFEATQYDNGETILFPRAAIESARIQATVVGAQITEHNGTVTMVKQTLNDLREFLKES